jgi:hypothetical protein
LKKINILDIFTHNNQKTVHSTHALVEQVFEQKTPDFHATKTQPAILKAEGNNSTRTAHAMQLERRMQRYRGNSRLRDTTGTAGAETRPEQTDAAALPEQRKTRTVWYRPV